MKLSHIIAIATIAIGIGVIISTAGNASTYVNFDEAQKLATNGNDAKVHVIGELMKDPSGNVINVRYNPQLDPNYLEFMLMDENQQKHTVITHNPPASMQDFFKSEKVVVIGNYSQEGHFKASEILMKCPSKYEETQVK
ncbi:MAG: cytochrome c maturation protein CcmE [Flammeovirgaceae bacterium]